MGNLKKRHQTTFTAMVMKAIFSVGFGILGLTICVLAILSISERSQLFTSDVFVRIENAVVIGYFCLVIILICLIAYLTAGKLSKKGQAILAATEKIRAQDLDFDINASGVREIDQVLDSINDMRFALKESLEKQWLLEQRRNNQIAALAHDLKTPMTVLKGNIDLLQIGNQNTRDKEYIADAKASLEEIEVYLTQLLEMVRTNRAYDLNLQRVCINVEVKEMVAALSCLADKKNITFLIEEVEAHLLVSADSFLLKRVFSNVLSNALDYTPENDVIKILISSENGKATICITDSGKGFSPNVIRHGSEQFYMDDTSRGRKNHYGLGLYIADSIIKQHNGTIELSNDEVIGGARITIHIPLIKE